MTLHLRTTLADALVAHDAAGDRLGPDARREVAADVITALVDELADPGPDRAAIVGSIAAALQNASGLCGDRRDSCARTALDAMLDRLRREALG